MRLSSAGVVHTFALLFQFQGDFDSRLISFLSQDGNAWSDSLERWDEKITCERAGMHENVSYS